jgi:ABC-type polysaccharide/polyol phosphate transport system ATPase subunit
MSVEPPAIEVRDLCKAFRMRARHTGKRPGVRLRAKGYRVSRVQVLDGISFEVERGDLFGIVGRNGSGKSTLLKILASIYDADSGSVKVAGRLAPFVELGVGFHPELTAWDNVRTNAVMMGLSPQQAGERFESILQFAELEDFQGLELKNYSNGMRMRLAFAALLQVDADVLLIDEILAVGDAKFQEKCLAAFTRLREQGKTILLVSHQAGHVRRYCNRALLLDEGKIAETGDPEAVVQHYLELHSTSGGERQNAPRQPALSRAVDQEKPAAEITEVWLEDSAGRVVSRVPAGDLPQIHALVEVSRGGLEPTFACEVHDGGGAALRKLDPQPIGGAENRVRPGDRLHVHSSVGADLPPGSYIATCRVLRSDRQGRKAPMTEPRLLDFAISRARGSQPAPQHASVAAGDTSKEAARL